MKKVVLAWVMAMGAAVPFHGASYYPERLEDARAVYLTPDGFGVKGDGKADDSAAVQAAIDRVQESTGEGIVFIPEGRYRITRTIYVWPGIRVIGYGAKRPVFVLGDNTPGYQQGIGYMFYFAGFRPRARAGGGFGGFPFRPVTSPQGTVPLNPAIMDANPGTFYSAMSNIDIEIGEGNAAAAGIRFHVAQHGYLAHMDFHVGSGLTGLNDVGNEGEDLHFYGGRYGILTKKPSPAWQFTLIDSTFEGQREAAIRENEAGLTLVDDEFRNVPTAVEIDEHYSDELWVKDARMENISGPAFLVSNENSRMTEINFENIVCRGVPVFARFRESGREVAGKFAMYEMKTFSHGLTLDGVGAEGKIQTRMAVRMLKSMPERGPAAIGAPPPEGTWVNLRTEGAKGDGVTDDTAAIRKAIAEHRAIYVPSGRYVVRDTIALRQDTVLIGLHPDATQFDLLDGTPGFQGPGAPRALLEAPRGGSNMVMGIGLYTGGINSRAVGALWMAGRNSLMDDVRFLGGHGTTGPDGKRVNPYNPTHTGDPDNHRKWDAQYPSLWVTRGGGGTFANIWTPDTFADAGMRVSDTATPGRVYELSSEHHVRNEIELRRVANWELYSLQTEEESGESGFALPLEIAESSNLTIANYHGYRVVRSTQPFRTAIRVSGSKGIRFRNVHVDSNSAMAMCDAEGNCRQYVRSSKVSFDDALVDETRGAAVRDREFAWLDWPGESAAGETGKNGARRGAGVVEAGARVEELRDGFFNISGAAVDGQGNLYFVDARWQRIYKWAPETKELSIVRDDPLDPVNLFFDKAGDLMVVSSGGKGMTVYTFRPDSPEDEVKVIEPEAAAERAGMSAALPVSAWVNGDFTNTFSPESYRYKTLEEMFRTVMAARRTYDYVSPDRTVFLPADEAFVQGEPYYGNKFGYVLQAYGLARAAAGHPFYVSNEAEEKTYKARVRADGTLDDLELFATQGGESLAEDRAGNVYLAAGQVYVYDAAGKRMDEIKVPERPNDIVFGGKDGRTLFILTRTALYALRTRVGGL